MDTRVNKYDEIDYSNMSRTKKNIDIYNSTSIEDLSRVKTNNNVSVICDEAKEINIDKIRKYLEMTENTNENKRVKLDDIDLVEEKKIERKEIKDYDINNVLQKARDSRQMDYDEQRYKKIDQKEYNILDRIKTPEEKEITKDDLNTEEKTIVNFINGMSKKEDLFKDLMGDDDNTVVMGVNELNNNLLDEALDEIDKVKKESDDLTKSLMLENERLKELIANNEQTSKLDLKKIEEARKIEETNIFKDLDLNEEDDSNKLVDLNNEAPKITKINDIKDVSEEDKTFFTNSLTFKKSDFSSKLEEDDEGGKGFFSKFAIFVGIIIIIATIVVVLNYLLELNWF